MRKGDDSRAEPRSLAGGEIGEWMLVDPASHPADRSAGTVEVGFGQDQSELVSPVTRNEIGRANLPLQDPSQLRHDPIPGFGAEPFVETPQLVDVEQDETEGERIPPGSLELFLQPPVERIQIAAPCEHIDREGASLASRDAGTSLLALQQPGGRLQHLLGETNLIHGKVRIGASSPK